MDNEKNESDSSDDDEIAYKADYQRNTASYYPDRDERLDNYRGQLMQRLGNVESPLNRYSNNQLPKNETRERYYEQP